MLWSLSSSTAKGLPWSRMAAMIWYTARCSRDTSLGLRSWCSVSWLTISIWNCLLYSADMRDIFGVARKSHLHCIDIVRYSNESWLDFHLPIQMFTDMGRSNRGGRDSIIADWETSANTFIPRVRMRCPKIMHIWDVSWPEPIVINAIHGEKQLIQLLPCCKMKRLVSIAWCSNEEELPQHDALSSVLPYHCAIRPPLLPRLDLLHAIRSANSCLTERKWVFEQKNTLYYL